MTSEEAIKNITLYVYMEVENLPFQMIQALDVARDALEKQIPKKPRKTVDWWMCPKCHDSFGTTKAYIDEVHKYCPTCGQRIDWGEE